ncbi:MAG: efflux RND transporter permease subunit [Candidatus Omnitrophica bacterium]|nr:efflux RND transporter permease subunit [Candidatus Omnitrophota bacterium]
MKIADFSVRNSLLVNMASVFILIVGLTVMLGIRKEAFPNVAFDFITVSTIWPGAQAVEVEKLLTIPLEKEIKGINGIDELESTSAEGTSFIKIKLDPDLNEIEQDRVLKDIEQAVDRVSDLPEDVEDPIVTKPSSKEIPVVYISLSGLPELELQQHAEVLEDMFEDVSGVARAGRFGWRDKEMWVEVNPDRLKEYHISFDELMSALASRNISVPAGDLRAPKEEFSIRTTGEFRTPEEIEEVIIRANDLGNWLRIRDVATVRYTLEDDKVMYMTDGERAIFSSVIKKEKGDAIRIVDEVKKIVAAYKKEAPANLKIRLIDDMSYYIRRRLNVLKNNGMVGIVLVVSCLLIFLNRWIALWTAFGIPIAFFITFIIMSYMGMSINLLTMFGLIIVLGMIVDDGIIISENVYRYIEQGVPRKQAAIIGTNEVVKPVTATVTTTLVAFCSLIVMSGIMGKFTRVIPQVVIIALTASIIEAFIILPSHLADFVKPPKRDPQGKILSKKESEWFKALLGFYTKTIETLLAHRYIAMGGLLLIFIFAGIEGYFMDRELFPPRGVETFYIMGEMPVGTSLEETRKALEPVEKLVNSLPKKDLDTYITQVGSIGEWSIVGPVDTFGSHLGQLVVYLTPIQHRRRLAEDIVDALREKAAGMKEFEQFEKLTFQMVKPGPPVGKPVSVRIKGEAFSMLTSISDDVKRYLQTLKGVKDISDDYSLGKDEIRIVVDRDKAAQAYLQVGDIARTVRYAFEGGVATTIKPLKAEEEIDVKVRLPEQYRGSMEAFDKILIQNKLGNLIPLNKVASFERDQSLARIYHLDGKRVVTVGAEVNRKQITSEKANRLVMKHFEGYFNDKRGYSSELGGEFEENRTSMLSLVKALLVALFLIYVILAATFQSLIQPLIIMLAIPFGLIGVIVAFKLHHEPVSFLAGMGIIGLIGVVVNDSIVLVEFINKKRKEGLPLREAVIQAGQIRLRPVILTTITTVGGLLPVAYGIGGNDPFLKPMALALSWGLAFATTLVIFMIPCIYLVLSDIKSFFCKKIFPNSKLLKPVCRVDATVTEQDPTTVV